MAIKKIIEEMIESRDRINHMIDSLQKKYEAGELSEIDVPVSLDIDSFKVKHPMLYYTISTLRKIGRWVYAVYKILRDHKRIPAIV